MKSCESQRVLDQVLTFAASSLLESYMSHHERCNHIGFRDEYPNCRLSISNGVMQKMNTPSRIFCKALQGKIMSADQAASLISSGVNVGMSGFTGSGYPKAVPAALAKRIEEANSAGEKFRIGVWTGASTAPELDGALAKVDGVEMRLPYQSDPICRQRINAGEMEYLDIHLSHVAQFVWFGFLGKLDIAVVEVAGILEDGRLIPSSSIGNNKTWLEQADKVILEVNSWQDPRLEGMHDVYYGTNLPPHRQPIPLVSPQDRIGDPYLHCDLSKVIAIVETHSPDRNSAFSPPDENSRLIAGHILEFLEHEVKRGRLPKDLLPLQSGVGNIANAVMAGLNHGPFENMTAYTEVLQDGMLEMIRSGKLISASATAFSLSDTALEELYTNFDLYRDKIVLRPQEISNHPEVIRRLGVIAMNGMIEADMYGNVNSTHVMGSAIMNGIGGSGDFARNAYISIFMTPSQAKNGKISCIVPMVSHVDHTEHDVQVLVTEQGLADLRGLSPSQRAKVIIENCAHPDFRPALQDYLKRSLDQSFGKHTPHLLDEALSWHQRYLATDQM
jgi:succinyl-CoA:acetate CoA-transferase